MLLTPAARARLRPAETALALPVPSRIVSNGEFTPPRQSRVLAGYEARLLDRATTRGRRLGLGTRGFLGSAAGMAAAFEALNESFGAHFAVADGEAEDAAEATRLRDRLSGQFVFDDQVHFLRDDADPVLFEPLTGLIELSAELLDLPHARAFGIDQIKFAHFLQHVFVDSDTRVALLSGAPSESDAGVMLSNDAMAAARDAVNAAAGSRRMLTHAVIAPGMPGWLDEVDRVHADVRPEGWKGYTVGEPFSPSERRWRLDDFALMTPAYERMQAAGVTNFAIHKGLLPADPDAMPGAEAFANVDDVGPAAAAWPGLNFLIYHAGYRTIPQPTAGEVAAFEATGRIDWVSDLADIPAKYGVSNVYADIAASFAFTVLTHPRLAAAMIGMLVKGLGADRVMWGTDSVWYGSPQWQIEAFRRLRMPEDLQARFGFPDLGEADGPLKRAILGGNAARLHGIDAADAMTPALVPSQLDAVTADWRARGRPSHRSFGWVAP